MPRVHLRAVGVIAWRVLTGCDGALDIEHVAEPPAMAPLCVEDTFDGPEVDTTVWIITGSASGTIASIDAQALKIDVPQAMTSAQDPRGGVHSATMDLVGGSAEVQLVQPPPSAQKSLAGLTIGGDPLNYYSLFMQTNQLVARSYLDGIRTDVVDPYDPVRHQFLRIRHDRASDEILFESRGADTDWEHVLRVPRAFSLELTTVTLSAQSFDIAPAFTSVFDNVAIYGACTR